MLRPEDCIPGTLVECIDDKPVGGLNEAPPLVRGRLYRLTSHARPAGVETYTVPERYGDPVATVEGVFDRHNRPYWVGIFRFRRLPDERLDVFRQMLAPLPTRETA